MKLLLILIAFSSCSTYRCYPSKGSRDYALIETKYTLKGYKHVFVSGIDTLIDYYPIPKKIGCYTFTKTK